MARLRYNALKTGAAGAGVPLALGASLTNSATSITFNAALTHSNGTAVPTITGSDYILLEILDSSGNLSEIVYLTAYTSGATTGTIVRGMEGTTGVAHSSGDKITHSPTRRDFLLGSADAPPNAPSAYDDEFDGASSVSWNPTPTAPTAFDINSTVAGSAYIKTVLGSAALVGRYQTAPASYPFTITAKVASTARGNYQRGGGIFIAPASPTNSSNVLYLGHLFHTGIFNRSVQRIVETFGGTAVSNTSQALVNNFYGPLYLKMVVTSATSVSMYASIDGIAYFPVDTGFNPGFTPGVMGIAANDEGASLGCEAWFDFFRVT